MKELIKFIKANKLKFQEGRRNSDSVILSGYALYLGIEDVEDIKTAIESTLKDYDSDYAKELEKVFSYAQDHNYESFWETDESKKLYIF